MKVSQTELTAALKTLRKELDAEGYVRAVMAIDDLLASPASIGRLATILTDTWDDKQPPSLREVMTPRPAERRSFK